MKIKMDRKEKTMWLGLVAGWLIGWGYLSAIGMGTPDRMIWQTISVLVIGACLMAVYRKAILRRK
jgi:formate/nitrite transporter FocA (FNT family)